ncbi:hypothetical protein N7505_001369 [Penicillium chrysogenum]|uniref:Uncharacterized protein n=1 Tax=Penicillium chrysogenum TaxID=5076 RepID=A0ABQ8WWL4_PENCH|nr:hypothetical protein N7505_001369 [Penicillium chrysogenum]
MFPTRDCLLLEKLVSRSVSRPVLNPAAVGWKWRAVGGSLRTLATTVEEIHLELGSNRGLTAAVRLSNRKNAVEGRDSPNCGWLCRCQKPHVVNRGSPAV